MSLPSLRTTKGKRTQMACTGVVSGVWNGSFLTLVFVPTTWWHLLTVHPLHLKAELLLEVGHGSLLHHPLSLSSESTLSSLSFDIQSVCALLSSTVTLSLFCPLSPLRFPLPSAASLIKSLPSTNRHQPTLPWTPLHSNVLSRCSHPHSKRCRWADGTMLRLFSFLRMHAKKCVK